MYCNEAVAEEISNRGYDVKAMLDFADGLQRVSLKTLERAIFLYKLQQCKGSIKEQARLRKERKQQKENTKKCKTRNKKRNGKRRAIRISATAETSNVTLPIFAKEV